MDDFALLATAGTSAISGALPTSDGLSGIDAAASITSDSLVASILMIFVSEIGDKTFLIAAILAMSNPRSTIFLAACAALWLMSILSAFLGHAVVNFVPMSWVSTAAAIMFLLFGIKLLQEARGMDGSEITKEMHSVESELSEKDVKASQIEMEAGTSDTNEKNEPSDASFNTSVLASLKNLLGLLLSPVFVETFVLVFLAEWGDRSQLATIALGAAKNVYGVAVGTIFGHTCCTGLAVLGGQLLASRISVKKVTYAGGVLFIIFAFLYGYEVYTGYE
ncbi:hypothetical protein GQ54DRAFT_254647 [Martensiomyces pterosporus]|nr:hypothetical protein GQ54DRAFT_254647 [Martensiomyces pterosporus]